MSDRVVKCITTKCDAAQRGNAIIIRSFVICLCIWVSLIFLLCCEAVVSCYLSWYFYCACSAGAVAAIAIATIATIAIATIAIATIAIATIAIAVASIAIANIAIAIAIVVACAIATPTAFATTKAAAAVFFIFRE